MKKRLRLVLYLVFLVILLISTPVRDTLIPILEEKPLSEHTIEVLKAKQPYIDFFADKYQISKVALAASIGSEINRRIFINKWIDILQDYYFASFLCTEPVLDFFMHLNINNRYFNLAKQDLGIGNIRFQTAWEILQKYPQELTHIHSKKEMVDYLLTDKGNIHIASLIIKKADTLFIGHFGASSKNIRDAIYYSYYKQGETYYLRYAQNSKFKRPPIPGGGKDLIEKIKSAMYLKSF